MRVITRGFSYFAFLFILGLVFSGCSVSINSPQTANTNSVNAANSTEVSKTSGDSAIANKLSENKNEVSNSAPQTSATPDKIEGQKVIDKYIAGVAKVSDASEYKEARKILYGDIDGDGDDDAIVQFTIEGMGGGNNYGFSLAAFKNDDGKLTAITDEVVGGKMNREVELKRIEKGVIYLDTKEYAENDGACCPSIEGKTSFVLEGKKLVEKKQPK